MLEEISQERILQELSPKGINWRFNPPLCPHISGNWERMIRSVKTAISATVKERAPRDEVLQTLFVEAENIVNGHPLTHVSIDFEDQDALTPNHFLLGCSNATFAPGTFTKSVSGLKKQWRIAQGLADQFWQRWVKEYLPTLTRRTKWVKNMESVKIGNVVIIADNSLPRNAWPKGKVLRVYPGKDGNVRVADVQTKVGIYRRPVSKICVLDVHQDQD